MLILPKIYIDHVPNCERKTMAGEKPLACEAFLDLVGARVEVKQRKWANSQVGSEREQNQAKSGTQERGNRGYKYTSEDLG